MSQVSWDEGKTWHLFDSSMSIFRPPGDYEPWEHDDDPSFAALPAGGRLAYSFPLEFRSPAEARFVRFAFTPLEGKGMGISELQVFDGVTVVPWPEEIHLPGGKS